MSDKDWRPGVEGGDYFLHQKKQLEFADRRPVIRRASDLVGPGIASNAVRITDYNDLLATFNGYFSSAPGANNAPNPSEAFVGYVISDSELGGRQVFTGLESGVEFSRTFNRSPEDPETMGWSGWSGQRVPASAQGVDVVETVVRSGWPTVLEPPTLSTVGEVGVYDRSVAGISITKQGVYTGNIQIGATLGGVIATLYIYRPNGHDTLSIGQELTAMNGTVHIPFTAWASDEAQGFSVVVTHVEPGDRTFWYRFSCTRVGDAV